MELAGLGRCWEPWEAPRCSGGVGQIYGHIESLSLACLQLGLERRKGKPTTLLNNTAEVVGGEALVLSLSVSPHKKGSWLRCNDLFPNFPCYLST